MLTLHHSVSDVTNACAAIWAALTLTRDLGMLGFQLNITAIAAVICLLLLLLSWVCMIIMSGMEEGFVSCEL